METRYEYKFVRIELKGMFTLKPQEDYQEIVHKHAAQGWRLVQIFAPLTSGNDAVPYFELIFEKSKP
jgi:hypothetical protein